MINLLFIILASFCNSVMDTLAHHWSTSVFSKIKNKFWAIYFGDATNDSWKNKYIDRDYTKGEIKWNILGIKYSRPVFLSDAWHLFKSLMIVFLDLAVIYPSGIITYPFIGKNMILDFIIIGIFWNLTFNLFYNKILAIKK